MSTVPLMRQFYQTLIFVVVCQVSSTTPVNKTTMDGKVFISGDHNEVILCTSQDTKKALAEIKSELNSLNERNKKFAERILSLGKHTERKLDLMNKSNAGLSAQVQAMAQRLTTLEKQEKLKAMNETVNALSQTLNQSNAALSAQVQAISQRLTTLEKQVGADYAVLFPRKGTSDHVMARGMPSLKEVTVCLWMKTADTGNGGTLLSYAVSGADNELLLIDYRNFNLWVGGSHRNRNGTVVRFGLALSVLSSTTSMHQHSGQNVVDSRGTANGRAHVSANDGKWHHICYVWENTAGSWKLYKDGKIAASGKSLKTGHVIRGGGALVLGQEQDSVGGSFAAHQNFLGEMSNVNIWDHVIKDQEIMRMSKSCLTGEGNVFQWREFKAHVKGSVQITHPSC